MPVTTKRHRTAVGIAARKRQKMMDRLGAVRVMLEHWPDMSAETKAWMIRERDKLIETMDSHPPISIRRTRIPLE